MINSSQKELKNIARYLYLSKTHNNNILYNFSISKSHKKFSSQMSPSTLNRYINLYKKEGDCVEKGNHLWFKSLNRKYREETGFTKFSKTIIEVKEWSIDQIYLLLVSKFIKNDEARFYFVAGTPEYLIRTKADLKRRAKGKSYRKTGKVANDGYNVSYVKLAQKLNCDTTTVFNLISKAVKAGLMTKKRRSEVVYEGFNPNGYIQSMNGSGMMLYTYKGKVYRRLTNAYKVL